MSKTETSPPPDLTLDDIFAASPSRLEDCFVDVNVNGKALRVTASYDYYDRPDLYYKMQGIMAKEGASKDAFVLTTDSNPPRTYRAESVPHRCQLILCSLVIARPKLDALHWMVFAENVGNEEFQKVVHLAMRAGGTTASEWEAQREEAKNESSSPRKAKTKVG